MNATWVRHGDGDFVAKSVVLACMRIQSYLVHITTNIKRIIKKMDETLNFQVNCSYLAMEQNKKKKENIANIEDL